MCYTDPCRAVLRRQKQTQDEFMHLLCFRASSQCLVFTVQAVTAAQPNGAGWLTFDGNNELSRPFLHHSDTTSTTAVPYS